MTAVALACGVWLGMGTAVAAAGTGYWVTFAARECKSYSDIFANRFRDNLMQTLQNVGPDSPYGANDLVNPSFEDKPPQSKCTPLAGWEFTMGSQPDLAPLPGPWGSLTVVNHAFPPVTTEDHTAVLDQDGEPIADDQIEGATTFELTQEQLKVANQGQWALRLQGGTPTDPVLAQKFNEGVPGEPLYGFGALRCGNDNNYGDNVEGISFPGGIHHIFCYEYLVIPPPTSGTITITKQVSGAPAGDNPLFPFNGNISYDVNGFKLANAGSMVFYRAGKKTWSVTEGAVANYRLERVDCTSAAGTSTFTYSGSSADIHLAEGDHATCVYHNAYVPPPGGLTIRKVTFGGVGTFSYTVTPSPTTGEVHQAQATTTQPGVPVDAVPSLLDLAPGHYVIAEQKPTSPDGRWHLRHVSCNGANRSTAKPFGVDIVSGESVVCTFVNSFVPRGSISIAKITEGGVGTASFVVTPATGPPTPHLQNATTTSPGVAAEAKPQTPADATGNLRLGTYHIVEQPPLSSTGDWALTAVVCNGVTVPFAQGTATIELTSKVPQVHCVFTNAFSAKPPVHPKPTPVPPNPTPGPPTANPAYDIADLVVTKVASAPVVTRGQVIGFRITVKNRGPNPAQSVVLDDQPRAAATVVAIHTTAGSCHQSGRLTVCPLGTLKPGASVIITVRTRVGTHGTRFVNRAVVGTSTLERTLANNIASAQISVVGPRRPVVGCASSVRPPRRTARIAC
jgi:uncharacterized repeat protein (TIGR01451 family)